jgi:hypothetical protein
MTVLDLLKELDEEEVEEDLEALASTWPAILRLLASWKPR